MPLSTISFRVLNEAETEKMVKWAIDNYEPFSPINGTWHPACQKACVAMNMAAANFVEDKEDYE